MERYLAPPEASARIDEPQPLITDPALPVSNRICRPLRAGSTQPAAAPTVPHPEPHRPTGTKRPFQRKKAVYRLHWPGHTRCSLGDDRRICGVRWSAPQMSAGTCRTPRPRPHNLDRSSQVGTRPEVQRFPTPDPKPDWWRKQKSGGLLDAAAAFLSGCARKASTGNGGSPIAAPTRGAQHGTVGKSLRDRDDWLTFQAVSGPACPASRVPALLSCGTAR